MNVSQCHWTASGGWTDSSTDPRFEHPQLVLAFGGRSELANEAHINYGTKSRLETKLTELPVALFGQYHANKRAGQGDDR